MLFYFEYFIIVIKSIPIYDQYDLKLQLLLSKLILLGLCSSLDKISLGLTDNPNCCYLLIIDLIIGVDLLVSPYFRLSKDLTISLSQIFLFFPIE